MNEKWSWWIFGCLLPVWSTTAFWILAKLLHLRRMLSKLMRCTKNCYACNWHWSTEMIQFFFTTTPEPRGHEQHFKSWTNWAKGFCLICHIHLTSWQLITVSSSNFDNYSPLPFVSLLLSAICKASSDNHFAFLHFFFLGMVLINAAYTM